jgi:thioredoxin reductase
MDADDFEVIIVGGGPAGLSAALVLGRARRRVLVLDDGKPRNARSPGVHGLLTREGTPPAELLRLGRAELATYPSITIIDHRAITAAHLSPGFRIGLADGRAFRSRKLILATGVVDRLPAIPGLDALYGRGVFHCPYCDGWEHRDRPLAAYGQLDDHGGELALELRMWSDEVVLCTDGPPAFTDAMHARLARHGIPVHESRVAALAPAPAGVEIRFANGASIMCAAMFVASTRHQASDLAEQLGCPGADEIGCQTDERGRTPIPGLFAIGDLQREILQVAVAIGEGSSCAITVAAELWREDRA